MMTKSQLNFSYPETLVATEPVYPPRVLFNENQKCEELSLEMLKQKFRSGDVLVVNETKVAPRKLFAKIKTEDESEDETFDILFLRCLDPKKWEVLFQTRNAKGKMLLPGEIEVKLLNSGRPQTVSVSRALTDDYFRQYGEAPVPPYILHARKEVHSRKEDLLWYQSVFAKSLGSVAAPTASLHFKKPDFDDLVSIGVSVVPTVLHVGVGTFLPLSEEKLGDHKMHSEWVQVPFSTHERILKAKKDKNSVWCLGTTATRAIESVALNMLEKNERSEEWRGFTQLFIKEDFNFSYTDRLITNFHQPETTLLALVSAFAGLENVLSSYKWAVENKMRLFSYGDLSVWTR